MRRSSTECLATRSLHFGGVTELEFAHSIHVARDPGAMYELVSDITRMGQWSPVCKACWWDEGAAARVGAWFTGRNESPAGRSEATGEVVPAGRSEATGEVVPARTWETRSQVVAADPGREFAWEVNHGWVRWGFTLEEADGPAGRSEATGEARQGTRLTQSWHFLPKGIAGFRERFGDRADAEIALRREAARSGIPVTLAAIKATAEAD
jgi:hypothetical protein